MHDNTLPRHARTGLAAVGWRKPRPGEDGPKPIWPILGGAPDDEDDTEETGDETDGDGSGSDGEDDDADPDGADNLGDAGKRALDAMKAKWREERDRRKAAESERDQLKATKPTEGGDDADSIRTQVRAEARAEALRERALDRLEAKAARVLADPEDARAYLSARVEDFIDGDAIDTEAITDALEDLLKRKPYLAATAAGSRPRFEGTGDGGARKASTGPRQLTENDVKRMTPEQIDEAHRKGQLRDYLGS
ncbi:hypothetical protein [Kitasatospora sp. A2-31]|uniref:hypothetical protein n=1 Tax=Kitasatospora sp. A2-31 TaxID=2916414 RepID=UPI001EED503B|nr:hypothetical protein [Kitasatospora sp. A2-31]MCG6499455.1 hypothetical protein [Kitasatospora sp. A2-31]